MLDLVHDPRLLGAFRAVMPNASGVVLASSTGNALASDVVGVDPSDLAADALAHRGGGESALVRRGDALYLVVFAS